MAINRVCVVVIAVGALGGCASLATVHGDVPGPYVVKLTPSDDIRTVAAGQVLALDEAQAFCLAQDKKLLIETYTPPAHDQSDSGNPVMRFKCLAPNDPALKGNHPLVRPGQ